MAPAGLLLVVVATAAAAALLLAAPAGAALPRVEHAPKADGTLVVLAVGDWGRRGQFNQTLVARQMGEVGQKMDIDFVISTGDNIYDDGIANTSVPLFKESSNIYTAKSLQKPWYLVLGNHDYTGNALAQLDPAICNVDSRYTAIAKSFIVNSGIADFFLVDTTPFILHYWNNTKFDWRGVAPRDTYIANLLKDLEYALTESKAVWKIVVGYHPISTGCGHGNNTELEQLLLPVLKALPHDIIHLQFLTSDGGSKAWAGKFKATPDKVEFLYDGQGFMSMRLSKTEAHLAFFDVAGNVLHCWGLTKTAAAGH
ncbi:purple acid phosphatase 3-like [Panicum miliaceum]|uniref:Purple acid phosphatase n=1 Tax=Panicum miliaceum TaxID=4540 RepID=A0A3L6PZP3_PANMI|nr:purple acid phosphatase 3-like [Panicum miliaceum]